MKEKTRQKINIITEIINRSGGTIMFIMVLIGAIYLSISKEDFTYMLMTTNITILLVCLAYAFNLDKPILNSVACVAFLLFFFIDFGLHLTLAIFQVIIILSGKGFSKMGILYGLIFYMVFMFTYDDVNRMISVIWFKFSPDQFKVVVFWLLLTSAVLLYGMKKWQHLLINNKNGKNGSN